MCPAGLRVAGGARADMPTLFKQLKKLPWTAIPATTPATRSER
jgi:hypothetical protein